MIIKKKNFFKREKKNISVINLNGVIGQVGKFEKGLNIETVEPILEKAFNYKNLRAVAINVNSPGGSPVQSELIYFRIKELSLEKKVPVYTFAHDVAASGGYFILCAGDEMFAHKSSIIGSIGVISAGFGFVDFIKKIGITRRVYAQGKNKSVLDPFQKEDKDSIKILKEAQQDVHESFKNIVIDSRNKKLNASHDELFNGKFWSGNKAKDLGLIDEVGDMRSILKKKFGNKIKFHKIEAKKKGILKEILSNKIDISLSGIIDRVCDKIEEKNYLSKFKI